MTYKGMHNYIHHINTWWWGKTITLVSKDGYSTVELQFDYNYPSIAFIKGLSVFSTRRKEGYGTEIMGCCEAVAKKEGYTFLQLSVNKEQDWLVEWYKHLGFVIIMKDEHEFTMLKTLKQTTTWKPSDLPHWKKSTLPNDNTTGFNSDYFCHKGYCINYKELFEKLPKE